MDETVLEFFPGFMLTIVPPASEHGPWCVVLSPEGPAHGHLRDRGGPVIVGRASTDTLAMQGAINVLDQARDALFQERKLRIRGR